jgi:hypothetical protein
LPQSSLLEIAYNPDYTIPINKLVIGKIIQRHNPDLGGYMPPNVLAESIQTAISKTASKPEQWKAGISVWEV